MTSRAARRRTAVALVLAAAMALGACGGGRGSSLRTTPDAGSSGKAPSGPPLQVLQAAATRTASTSTARMAMSVGADFSGLPSSASKAISSGRFTVGVAGALDLGAKRARLDLDLSQLPSGQRAALKGGRLVMIVDNQTVYVQAAGLGIRSDKPWIKVDAAGGGGGLDLTRFAQEGPGQGLQLINQLGDASVVGQEQLRGAATTHYHGSLDLGKAMSALGGGGGGGLLGSGGQALPGLSGASVPVDAWVDGGGRVRKLETRFDLIPFLRALFAAFGSGIGGQSQPNGAGSTLPANAKAEISLSFELYDFGAAVDVAPPPADQVGPAPSGFSLPGSSPSSTSG
jgi:hypothetical protein